MTKSTNINDTIASLEGLYNGYSGVLAEARAQLEGLDIDQEKLDAAVAKVFASDKFQTDISRRVTQQLMRELNSNGGWQLANLIKTITTKVWENLESSLTTRMDAHVKELLASQQTQDTIIQTISSNQEIDKSLKVAEHMNQIMREIAGSWEEYPESEES